MILFLLFFGLKGFALSHFPQDVYLGEKKSIDYFGPTSPAYEYNEFSSLPIDRDERLSETPYYKYLNFDLMNLKHFLQYDLSVSGLCSNVSLAENYAYIRYLYRLIVLSYLYEANMSTSATLKKLNVNTHVCHINWPKLLKKCEAKSSDMKTFLRRANQIASQTELLLPQDHSYKKFSDNWLKMLADNNNTDATILRIRQLCQTSKLQCDNSLMTIQKNLSEICERDQQAFLAICSEQDQGYGYSKIPLIKELIASSNAMLVLNGRGEGTGCLSRYQEQNEYREKRSPELELVFSPLFNLIKSTLPPRFHLGRLFLPGALREFDDKGLKEFLFTEVTPPPTPTPTPTIVSTPLIVKTQSPTPTPKPVKTPTPAPKIVLTSTPIPIKKSAFLLASEKLDKEHLEQVIVDMEQLKTDFIFSEASISKLHDNLKKFQTRQALSDMKEFDFLGTKAVPVKLIFLKYLIENNEHQGLFNMRAILGEKFYVLNDLDKFSKKQPNHPRMILIQNNAQTNNRWQISVIRETTKL